MIESLQIEKQKLQSEKENCQQQLGQYEKELTLQISKLAQLEETLRQNERDNARLEGEGGQLKETLREYQKQNFELHAMKANNEMRIALLEAEIKQLYNSQKR